MRKQLLTKMLLIAASLFVGTSAWGAEITETYDFGAFITANGAPNLTISGDGIAQSGTSAKVGTVKVINNPTSGGNTLDLKGRFAVDYASNAGSQIRFMWRSSGNAYQHGLAGNWNGKGSADPQGAARFSVLNLKDGDKITLTYAKQAGKAADPYTCAAGSIKNGATAVAVDAALASGTTYTKVGDGNLDLYFTNNNFAISKIVIQYEGSESMGAPTIAVTGANGGQRTVTITPGEGDGGSAATGTYYTLDGTDPTSASTAYTAPFTVDATTTVKAVSYLGSTIGTVAERVVEAGTTIKLNNPTYVIGTYSEGSYNLTLNATQTVVGTPTATVSYTIDGGSETNVASGTVVSVAVGSTIQFWAVAAGYDNSDNVSATPTYIDFSSLETVWTTNFDALANTLCGGTNNTSESLTLGSTPLITDYYNITNEGFNSKFGVNNVAWSVRYYGAGKVANTGLWPYNVNGSMVITDLVAGDVIVFTGDAVTAGTNVTKDNFMSIVNNNQTFVVTSSGSATFTPTKSGYIHTVTVYNSGNVPTTISAAGWSTLFTPYALDFSGVAGLTAYTATCAGSIVTLTPVENVPANTGVVLKGAANDYNIPVIASSSTAQGDLKGSATVAKAYDTTYDYYYLVKSGDNAQFKKLAEGGSIAAGKAYLQLTPSSARELSVVFEDGTTAISTVQLSQDKQQNECFDLQGRRVAQPTKGLYIVNGKKVVIK